MLLIYKSWSFAFTCTYIAKLSGAYMELIWWRNFFIWFIIAHIKTVRKASLVLFFTVDSIYANFLLQIFDNIKKTITMVIWISFPQSFKNHPHFINLKAIIPIFCDITQVNKYQSSVTENTELDGHVISSPSDLLKVELSYL